MVRKYPLWFQSIYIFFIFVLRPFIVYVGEYFMCKSIECVLIRLLVVNFYNISYIKCLFNIVEIVYVLSEFFLLVFLSIAEKRVSKYPITIVALENSYHFSFQNSHLLLHIFLKFIVMSIYILITMFNELKLLLLKYLSFLVVFLFFNNIPLSNINIDTLAFL